MVPTVDAAGQRVVDWDGMSTYGRILRNRAERRVEAVVPEPERDAVGGTLDR